MSVVTRRAFRLGSDLLSAYIENYSLKKSSSSSGDDAVKFLT